ncbi:MAG TPA: FAD-dependent oxidoreductase [Casimicrobiaceae bacterium]|nr:FAD-dependent oxidoreductase [Casimicrobiaceae bacterium]
MRSVVIVGASLAGLSAAKALRRQGFDGTVTLIGDEPHRPYQRPPLSKQLLGGAWDRARLDLPDRGDLCLDWILGTAAASLDLATREVTLDDGRRVRFDGLVIATGARARKPRWHAELRGVFTLRTVEDALALRAHVAAGHRNVAIVGAGFIGCETAATLRSSGCDVTLIDCERLPMLRALGESLGAMCRELHEAHGVRTVFGAGVEALLGRESVEGVRLSDASIVDADCVVVGAGVTPNVEWLAGSGLVVDDGVVCDSTCAALGSEAVVAAGDVARWEHPHYGLRRIEHWNNAIAQADAAAGTLLAMPRRGVPYAAVPFFWSDQYDCKLQLIGAPAAGDATRVVEGALGERRFVMLFEREGRVSGAFLFNSMHRVAAYTTAVEGAVGCVAEGVGS